LSLNRDTLDADSYLQM